MGKARVRPVASGPGTPPSGRPEPPAGSPAPAPGHGGESSGSGSRAPSGRLSMAQTLATGSTDCSRSRSLVRSGSRPAPRQRRSCLLRGSRPWVVMEILGHGQISTGNGYLCTRDAGDAPGGGGAGGRGAWWSARLRCRSGCQKPRRRWLMKRRVCFRNESVACPERLERPRSEVRYSQSGCRQTTLAICLLASAVCRTT